MSRFDDFDELVSLANEFASRAREIRDYLELGARESDIHTQFQGLERIADELAKATAEAVS